MDKLAAKVKKAYEEAANSMSLLQQKYKKIEITLRGSATKEEKLAATKGFDLEQKEIGELVAKTNKIVSALATRAELFQLVENNAEVKAAYNSYLFHQEEAEYMYPHARGAVLVFERHNEQER